MVADVRNSDNSTTARYFGRCASEETYKALGKKVELCGRLTQDSIHLVKLYARLYSLLTSASSRRRRMALVTQSAADLCADFIFATTLRRSSL
jgi:hypothetical protein